MTRMVGVRFEILGPLRIDVDGGKVDVAGRRTKVVLAMLVLYAGDFVPMDLLIDALWGELVPKSPRNLLHVTVSRLRMKLARAGLPGELLRTEQGGYRIMVDREDVDLFEFRHLRDEARSAAAKGLLDKARDLYQTALALWRGSALSDIDSDVVRSAAITLDEERIQVLEEHVEVELASGRAGELIAELTRLVQDHPYRERLHGSLILALYRAGRQADALAAYRRVRDVLHSELGTEPGRELQQLHLAILNRDPELDAPPRAPSPPVSSPQPPRELPSDIADFTGRVDALKTLDCLLPDGSTNAPAPVVTAVIVGTAGVGKTALAVHLAHRVADRFPDGQMYLNLRGYATIQPLRSVDALAALLRSLGIPPGQIPTDEAEAAARFRSTLAGRRVLIVLDNAGSVEQVRPLLPGTGGCLVLVTSRDRLAGLVARDGAHRVTLDVLTRGDAHGLLARLLGADRIHAATDATAALAHACAYLPIALRIAAANLIERPHQTIAGYLAELTTDDRLSHLQVYGDPEAALRATFDLSYQRLETKAQRMFRLLGLIAGPDASTEAAAALAGVTVNEARALLARLASAHLVTEHAPGRVTFHDLLHVYASERAERDEHDVTRRDAVHRLLCWYACGTAAAADSLYPDVVRLPTPPDVERATRPVLRGPAEALEWLDAERANLVAAIRSAATVGPREFAWQLTSCLYGYFWHQRHSGDWLEATCAALSAAEHEHALAAQAAMKWSLAGAHRALGRSSEAVADLTAAADLARESKWDEGECHALANLGTVHVALGQFEQASRCLARALSLAQRTRRRALEAQILGSLGYLRKQAGRLREAAAYCARQLSVNRQLYPLDSPNVARSLSNLGSVEHELGLLESADEKLTTALALHREAGRRWGEVNSLISLAGVRVDAGNLRGAYELAQAALSLARKIGDPRKIGEAYDALGLVHSRSGRPDQAIRCHQTALDAAEQNGDPSLRFLALYGLSSARCYLQQYETAATHAMEAWDLAIQIGYRVYQGLAMTVLASVRHGQDRVDEAHELAHRAVEELHAVGYRLGESRARVVLGNILQATGEAKAAAGQRDAARQLLQDIGAPVPDELAAG